MKIESATKPYATMKGKKKKFLELLRSRGYKSLYKFAQACGMSSNNMYTQFNDECDISLERAFRYANALGVPVSDVLEIFRPEEMKANKKAIAEYKVPVEE